MSDRVYREVGRFPSSSSGKVYVVKQDQDGNLSCDCPAWRFKKPGQERSCKHTEAVASGTQPPVPPASQARTGAPTGKGVEDLMADIERARSDRATGKWKPLSQALQELDKDTEGG